MDSLDVVRNALHVASSSSRDEAPGSTSSISLSVPHAAAVPLLSVAIQRHLRSRFTDWLRQIVLLNGCSGSRNARQRKL